MRRTAHTAASNAARRRRVRRAAPAWRTLGWALAAMTLAGCATRPDGEPAWPRGGVPAPAAARVAPATLTLRGSITYLQRVAMHPGAVIAIRLWELPSATAERVLIAERRLDKPGEVPVDFEMTVDAGRIDPTRAYALDARILVEDTVLFATDTAHQVLTQGHPSVVQLVLVRPTAAPDNAG